MLFLHVYYDNQSGLTCVFALRPRTNLIRNPKQHLSRPSPTIMSDLPVASPNDSSVEIQHGSSSPSHHNSSIMSHDTSELVTDISSHDLSQESEKHPKSRRKRTTYVLPMIGHISTAVEDRVYTQLTRIRLQCPRQSHPRRCIQQQC